MRNKEWIKKSMAMMVTATMLTSISGCASKSNGVELSDTTVVAQVAEVDGDVVTVTMGTISSSGSSDMGMAPGNGQGTDGSVPEKPSEEQESSGEMPEKPSGEQESSGEMLEKSSDDNTDSTKSQDQSQQATDSKKDQPQ